MTAQREMTSAELLERLLRELDEGRLPPDAIATAVSLALERMRPEVEKEETTELSIGGQYDGLRVAEIVLGPGADEMPRYALVGVPETGISARDRERIVRVLYALPIERSSSDG